MGDDRRLFRNNVDRVIGVVTLDHHNDPKGTPLQPGETAYLNETEMRMTANAPRDPADNPFTNGDLVEVSPDERPVDPRPIPAHQAEGKTIPPEDAEATAAAKAAEEPVVEPGNLTGDNGAEEQAQEQPAAPEEETGVEVPPEQQDSEDGKALPEEEVATPDAQEPPPEETGDEPAVLSDEEWEAAEEAAEKTDEPEGKKGE